MIKNIIFDVDGTLIDTSVVNLMGLCESLKAENIHLTMKDLVAFEGMPGLDVLQKLQVKNIDGIHQQWVTYVEDHHDEFSVYYGIPTLLNVLSTNFRLSLVTSRNKKEVESDKKLQGMMDYFEGVITCNDTKMHKPHPAPLLMALDKFGYRAEETIYVGDSIYDYESAKGSGIRFFKAEWGKKNFEIVKPHQSLRNPFNLLMHLV